MHLYQDIVGRLRGVRWTASDQFKALCPTHPDRNPSLAGRVGRNGKLLLKCHARRGCTVEGIVEALGFQMRDTFPDRFERGTRKAAPMKQTIDRVYQYTDEHGELLFETVRLRDPKDFKQRRPMPVAGEEYGWSIKAGIYRRDRDGSWRQLRKDEKQTQDDIELPEVRRVLYRLVEIGDAFRLGHDPRVVIVEGEKDVDALWDIGCVATCNPMGAGKWLGDYSKSLAGRRCCIVPDHDEPGIQHAVEVAGSLQLWGAASITIVHLPDLEEGQDVSDWLGKFPASATAAEKRAALYDLVRAGACYQQRVFSFGSADHGESESSGPVADGERDSDRGAAGDGSSEAGEAA